MQADRPKQYLPLKGKTVIQQTLNRFDAIECITGIVVAVSESDHYWPSLNIKQQKKLMVCKGGAERCHSVLNALYALGTHGKDQDWVLVHDAARPCVAEHDIKQLIEVCSNDDVGGLLAVPVSDTMKRSNESGRTVLTEDRSNLWHALTPQMFRLGMLRHALEQAIENEVVVTDEASAMEYINQSAKLVEASASNIKITRPGDLLLAEFYLEQQDK
jgi:2-C-methyl-D-erythritol 4-phosphate cytidylyltransferase